MLSLLEELAAYSRRWLTALLVLGISLSLPLSLAESAWVPGLRRLVPVALLAALLGLWAGSRARGRWLPIAVAAVGLLASVVAAARAWPLLAGSGERLLDAWRRLAWWAEVLWLGGTTDDALVSLVAAGLLIWGASFWLGWAIERHDAALAAALPSGTILAANTFFSLGGSGALLLFPPAVLVLMAQTRAHRIELRATPGGGHLQVRVATAMLAASLVVASVIIAASVAATYRPVDAVAEVFWSHAERPWKRVMRLAHWVFPAIGGGDEGSSWFAGEPSAAMPSARALSSGSAAGSQVVMRVRTSDPAPLPISDSFLAERLGAGLPSGPTRYWRGMTYDTYTGGGWANSDLDITPLPVGQTLQQPEGPREEVAQQIDILVPHDELLYAVAEPISLDVDSRPRWRGAGDFAFVNASVGSYSVVSAAPDLNEAELRRAGTGYPGWVVARYLALPDVPQRVLDLAREVTAGAETPYDKLLAIEAHLRANYTYDLTVPAPAEGKDVVWYFLFETGRGFCDYYASAMVVMARAVGVPARLASGYATGSYDYEGGYYVVRESDAHSWPEAYFPGLGWIDFEPTVSQERIVRPSGVSAAAVIASPSADTPGEPRRAAPSLLLVGAALLAVALPVVVLLIRSQHGVPADPVVGAYAGLERSGEYLGMKLSAAWTPREFSRRLSEAIVGVDGRPSDEAPRVAATADVATVAAAYEQSRYGRRLPAPAAAAARAAWSRLRRLLRPVLWRRLPGVITGELRQLWLRMLAKAPGLRKTS